jgi:hypothetical protein
MSLFRVVNDQAQFDAASNVSGDVYGGGIRFTQGGSARATTTAGTFFNQGIPMSESGQVAIVDATAGLPAGTNYLNGLPINGNRICVSRNPRAVFSSGLPFDSNGALAAAINFDLNFIGTDTLDPQVTFTRASTATFFNSAGVLTSAAINTPRFDYNPSTLAAQGLLIEEARTNSIRNNTMVGAVAGTPGTLPTNWSTNLSGLTREIVGTGTQNGITYIDIRLSGTTTSTGGSVTFEVGTAVSATNGQSWAESSYISLLAGSIANITTIALNADQRDSGGVFLASLNGTDIKSSISASLTRFSQVLTTNNASIAFIQPFFRFAWANGAAIDITLRIGLPQLELGAFATSVIPTTTTALTRAADVASVNTLSPWYNAAEGTLYCEHQVIGGGPASFVARLSSAASNEYMALGYTGTLLVATASSFIRNGASPAQSSTTFSTKPAGVNKELFKYSASLFKDVTNATVGGNIVPSSGVPTPTSLQWVTTASSTTSAHVTQGAAYIRRLTYYPRSLSDAEAQALTA